MKNIKLLLLIFWLPLAAIGQTEVKPGIKSPTSFAIIIDNESYSRAKEAVDAYKAVIEKDGLGTYIFSHDWANPDQVKAILLRLYKDGKSPLEGAVFVGDIPIPMIRDAHHLTSAFKMDPEAFTWQRSSVPSDRFYDDFGLEFKYLKQDTASPYLHYYSLIPESKQYLSSDIYTARIRPLEKYTEDKYQDLADYLNKVVRERTENPDNVLDRLSVGRGHGYNSESNVSWAGEQLALKEQLPNLFKTGGFVRFMDFQSRYPIKNYYLNEVSRDDLDVMLFHHHGSYYYQYLNGLKDASDPNTSIYNIKNYLRSKILYAIKKGKDKEEAIQHYMDYLDVPRSWCESAFDPKEIEADSLLEVMKDISVPDILAISPNARFVMFDACFNGSFHRDEYIAGAYLFNDGKTLVTQANTVNTIQDKWPDEFIGLLGGGLRLGQLDRHVHFLETHLFGDPTFRFANNSLDFDINNALALHSKDLPYWRKLTSHPHPDVRAMAWYKLFLNDEKELDHKLVDVFKNSDSMIERLEALKILSILGGGPFHQVLQLAVYDSYELIRRFASEYIGKTGSDDLIPAFASSMLLDNTSQRISFKHSQYLKLMDPEKLIAELKKQMKELALMDNSVGEKYIPDIERNRASLERDLKIIMDPESKEKDIKSELRSFRNHPSGFAADSIMQFAADPAKPEHLRVIAIEALGWYNYSYRKGDIIEYLQQFISDGNTNDPVNAEALKSFNRLKGRR